MGSIKEDQHYNAMLKLREGIWMLREAGFSIEDIRDGFESELDSVLADLDENPEPK